LSLTVPCACAAIEIFERAGTEAVDDRLLKYGAKEHFFKAGLCHLAAAVRSLLLQSSCVSGGGGD
jgi:hypothetical protein